MSAVAASASVAGAGWFRGRAFRRVFALLNRDDGEARVVGGAVRNALLGLPSDDIDIATTLRPEAVIARARQARIRAMPTGIDHGTVTLATAGKAFEVTTLRADMETDGRHARVAFGTDWAADARRRDLTINALYADSGGQVIDPVGGLADLEAGTVRFIGEAAVRIAEDRLRILRFFRFYAFYGRGRPDREALLAVARLKGGLSALSGERTWSELKRLLAAPDPSQALLWMRRTGVLDAVLPELRRRGVDAVLGVVRTGAARSWPPDPLLRLMAIVRDDASRLDGLATRLRLANSERERLTGWAGQPTVDPSTDAQALQRCLYCGDPAAIADRLRLQLSASEETGDAGAAARLARLLTVARNWRRPRFPLTGEDLIEAGHRQGPALGRALRSLEAAWVESGFRLTRATLLARAAGEGDD